MSTLAACVLVVLAACSGSTEEPSTSSIDGTVVSPSAASSTSLTSGTSENPPAGSDDSPDWSILTMPGTFDQGIEAVVAAADGFVAAGWHNNDGSTSPKTWYSTDGYAWSGIGGNEERAVMEGIATNGPLVAAVGWSGFPEAAAVWISTDAANWDRAVVTDTPTDDKLTKMLAVTHGGPGFVAVGWDWPVAAGATRSSVVWTSVDGGSWTRSGSFGGLSNQMRAVTAGPIGLVAVGWEGDDTGASTTHAAVWSSPDGVTWSRVPHAESVFGGDRSQVMNSVIAGGPGYVAVGWDGDLLGSSVAAFWTSTDGQSWARVRHEDALFGDGVLEATGVANVGGALVAVGHQGDPSTAVIWTSSDGLSWHRAARDDSLIMVPLAVTGNDEYPVIGGVAYRGSDSGRDAARVLVPTR